MPEVLFGFGALVDGEVGDRPRVTVQADLVVLGEVVAGPGHALAVQLEVAVQQLLQGLGIGDLGQPLQAFLVFHAVDLHGGHGGVAGLALLGPAAVVMGKTLNKKTLGASTIRVPSLETQAEIARLLDSVMKQLDTANRQLALLDDLVKSRFVEMFGDPCDPGSSSAKSRIDSFCELRIGPFGSALHKEDYITGGHPLVNPSHIIGGAIRPDENLTIDDGKYESLAAYHLLPGDVVLGRRGEIGRCAVVKTDGLICGTAA